MKKITVVLALLISVNSSLFAQKKNTEQIFEIPQHTIGRIFYMDLDKGDKIKLELGDLDDLDHITNLDSILHVFIQDIEPLKDSLADGLTNNRIDYVVDASGKNKIRVQKFAPGGQSYLASEGNIAALKLEQDTLYIMMKAKGGEAGLFGKSSPGFHYIRIGLFVNNLTNLAGYMNGRLQASINELKKNATKKWVNGNDGMMHVKEAPSISANLSRGQIAGYGDYLNLRVTADIQNYKNYFVPSISAGFAIVTNRKFIKREFSLMGEYHFTFSNNSQGKLQTSRNTFLTLAYSQSNTAKGESVLGLTPSFSLGYLINGRGDIYEKNTFRLGFGKAIIGNRLKLEPIIYFNDFFKGVTPGIRISL